MPQCESDPLPVQQVIARKVQESGPGDVLFIHYSGHGTQVCCIRRHTVHLHRDGRTSAMISAGHCCLKILSPCTAEGVAQSHVLGSRSNAVSMALRILRMECLALSRVLILQVPITDNDPNEEVWSTHHEIGMSLLALSP